MIINKKLTLLYHNNFNLSIDTFYNFEKVLPDAEIKIGENTLQIVLVAKWNGSLTAFEKAGLKVFTEKYEDGNLTLVISPSGIPNGEFEQAARMLADVLLCES